MLSFAAEFVVKIDTTVDDLLMCLRQWITGMRRSNISQKQLEVLGKELRTISTENEILEVIRDSVNCGIRYSIVDQKVEWKTEIVLSSLRDMKVVSVRTSRESHQVTNYLPEAKRPIITNILLDQLTDFDGGIPIKASCMFIGPNEVNSAADGLWGSAGNRLPIVYLSLPFSGSIVNGDVLSKQLYGLAHIYVEQTRETSKLLQSATDGMNAYGGAIGIYWPLGEKYQIIQLLEFKSQHEIESYVVGIIKKSWMTKKQSRGCTWEDVSRKAVIDALKSERQSGADEFSEVFDGELQTIKSGLESDLLEARALMIDKEADLRAAENEIHDLRQLIGETRKKPVAKPSVIFVDKFVEAFPGEATEVILDALSAANLNLIDNSRRKIIIEQFLSSYIQTKFLTERRDKLKSILKGYTSMNHGIRNGLKTLGFEIDESSPHVKLTYLGDDNYLFVLSKTGSDHRAGLNSASEIGKRIF